jgi:hypothetical protein
MSDVTTADSAWDRRRWLILGVIGLAQLMVVLDLTVMNVALRGRPAGVVRLWWRRSCGAGGRARRQAA